jgi:exodeoxyribonuclease VII large subunit
MAAQRFGIVSGRLAAGLAKNAAAHERDLVRVSSRLSPMLLQRPQAVQRDRLDAVAVRLQPAAERRLERLSERLTALGKLHASVDPERPLERGFARVTRADGSIVHQGAALASGEAVSIKFGDRVTREAVIDGDAGPAPSKPTPPPPRSAKPRAKSEDPAQGDLF